MCLTIKFTSAFVPDALPRTKSSKGETKPWKIIFSSMSLRHGITPHTPHPKVTQGSGPSGCPELIHKIQTGHYRFFSFRPPQDECIPCGRIFGEIIRPPPFHFRSLNSESIREPTPDSCTVMGCSVFLYLSGAAAGPKEANPPSAKKKRLMPQQSHCEQKCVITHPDSS